MKTLLFILLTTLTVKAQDYMEFSRKQMKDSVIARINHEREIRGIPPLKLSKSLQRSAQRFLFFKRKIDRHPKAWMNWRSMFRKNGKFGEVLAWQCYDSRYSVTLWMNSAPHKEAILSRRYKKIGIGYSAGVVVGRLSN